MQILFIVVNDLSFLDKIFEKFLELKVRGATMIDSEGMAAAIMKSEGLLGLLHGPFSRSLAEDQKASKTIFTVIPEEERAKEVIREIQLIMKNSKREVIGFMFTVPVSGIYPLKPQK